MIRKNRKGSVEILKHVKFEDMTQGWINKVKSGYVVFLDYDCDYQQMKDDVQKLQCLYTLGDAVVLESTKGYHVYFLDIVSYRELLNVMLSSSVEMSYVLTPIKTMDEPTWTLRIGKKDGRRLKFRCILHSSEPFQRKRSKVHAMILNKCFDAGIVLTDGGWVEENVKMGMYVIRDKDRYQKQK